MADNIFGGLARGIRGGVAQTQQQRQLQQVDDDRAFNRLVSTFSLIPKTDVASRQRILDQISELSDGHIPKLNIEQGTTVMGILAPSLKEHAEGKITKDEVLSRIGVLGLQQPTEAAGLEKFATGFEERGTTQELQQAQAISGLPEEQFIKGGGARAIAELRGRSPEGREILAEERKPGKGTALDNKIAAIQSANPGVTLQDATNVATGVERIIQDPTSGSRVLVNTLTGEERPLTPQGEAPGEEVTPEIERRGPKLWDIASLATGPVSAALQAGSVVSGAVGGPIAEETAKARQFMQSAQNELIRALSINPRFPVGEINRIREEVNISPKILDNPKLMQARMISIDQFLSDSIDKKQVTANNRSLPVQTRRDARSSIVSMQSFLDTLGVPPQVQTSADFNSLPSGTVFIDPEGNERRKP